MANLRSSGSSRRGRKRESFCYSRLLRRPDVGGAPFTTQFLIANGSLFFSRAANELFLNQPLSLQKISCGGRFAAAFLIATVDNSEIQLSLLESAHTHFLIATKTAFSEIRIICPAAISSRF
jgi:hypothetical protein